jgi:thioester reductase-like protein
MTGVTGFLGSHILRHLIQHGEKIHCLRRRSSTYERIDDPLNSLIQWVDLEDCDFEQYFKKNDIQYHYLHIHK